MLGSLFPSDHRRYLSLPLLGPVVDSFDDWLASNGYTQLSRKQAIFDLAHVAAQLRRRRIKEISNLTLAILDDCRKSLIKKHPRCAGTVRPLERYLVAKSLIVPSRPAVPTSTASILIEEYARFLSEVRGLAVPTIEHRRYTAPCFLRHLQEERIRLKKIQAAQIESYICKVGKRLSRITLQNQISALREFLRFLAADGRAPEGLASQIDTPRLYQHEKLPRSLPWETVRAFLRCIDRTSAKGLRDYAMFLLMATYGLRSSEVVALTLDDLRCMLRIHQKKTASSLELPLNQGSLLRAGEASEANSTTKATSKDLFENVCPDRCAETRGCRGSFSLLGSEKWSRYSLPWSTLFAPFPGGSSSAKRNPSQDHR